MLEGLRFRMGGMEAVGEGNGGDEVGPAVGFEDGSVEVVVNLLEEGDEALVVDGFGLGVERGAGAEEVEDVVEAGEGERGVQGLLALAMGVEALAEVADFLLQRDFGEGWEGVWIKTDAFVVSWAVFECSSPCQTPRDMG